MKLYDAKKQRIRYILTALMFFVCCTAFAQVSVNGSVRDTQGEPIVGASVILNGKTSGVASDIDGLFAIKASQGDVLNVTAVGYQAVKVKVPANLRVNIVMREDRELLDEVVVIGYGSTTKKELTGSVTSMKREDLGQGTFTNGMGMLQGKVAGLQVNNPNGADPTAKYEILLRGTNTLSAGQGPLVIIDGVMGADIRNINFQEIESIDVLKDGSAAAIYGTRGTNGVIIITTKRAQAGQTQVTYDGQLTVGTVSRRAKPLSASDFRSTIENYRPELSSYIYDGDTDWFKEITRTPWSHKHTVGMSGGTDKFSHYSSINYEYSEGLQNKNNAEKILARTNIRQSALRGWLDLDLNLLVAHRKYNPASTSAFSQAFTHNPTETVYDATNTTAGGYSRIPAMEYYNPVAMVNERDVESVNNNFGGNVRAKINILPVKGLSWSNFLSLNRETYKSKEYYSHYYPSYIGTNGRAYIENYNTNDVQYESTINYNRTFGNHNIQALLGYTYQYSVSETASMKNTGFDFDDFLTNNIGDGTGLALGTADMYSYKEDNTYIAFFGRVNYSYLNRYMISVSLRRDGSSRFGADNKWGWFPAVSAGWRLSDENFMKETRTWLNDLKIRAGYGVTGNQDFSNYKSLVLMTTAGKFWYNGEWINTYEPASNPNPDLQWEKKSEFNIGLDASTLNNRLSLTFDYYNRRTSNLLYTYTVPTPPYLYDELFTNVGVITNRGIEATITAIPVQTPQWQWTSTFVVSHNTNKLDKFTNEEFQNGTYKVGWSSGAACYTQRLIEGQSLGTFYGPIWLGTDTDGKDVLLGQNADGSVPEEEWVNLGTAYPDVTLGWTNTVTYGNWDLNFTLRASLGGKILNSYAMEYANLSSIGLRNISDQWLDNTEFTSTTYKYSSKYLEDASYLKLDNISLGYNFKLRPSSVVKALRLSFTAQNVFTITKYKGVDPEVSMTGLAPGIESLSYYPRTTQFTFGVNARF